MSQKLINFLDFLFLLLLVVYDFNDILILCSIQSWGVFWRDTYYVLDRLDQLFICKEFSIHIKFSTNVVAETFIQIFKTISNNCLRLLLRDRREPESSLVINRLKFIKFSIFLEESILNYSEREPQNLFITECLFSVLPKRDIWKKSLIAIISARI